MRRGELLDCAQALFLSKGYEATTVADIIERAGASKGGFYHHFAAKADLLEALAERMAGDSLKSIRQDLEGRRVDAVARMNAVLSQSRQFKVREADAVRAVFEVIFDPENIVLYHRVNQAVAKVVLPLFVDILGQGKGEGRFRIDDPVTTAEIILHISTSLHSVVAQAIKASGTPQADEATDALERRLRQHGISIDRILGLPDGTIVLSEPGFVSAVMANPSRSQRQPART